MARRAAAQVMFGFAGPGIRRKHTTQRLRAWLRWPAVGGTRPEGVSLKGRVPAARPEEVASDFRT